MTLDGRRPRIRSWARLAGAAGLLLFACATKTFADPDLWGHLRFGLDTVETRTLPTTYPYAFTQDRPWINHEYGSEIAMALAYLGGGIAGLTLLKGVLVFAALLLVWRALRGADLPVRMGILGAVVLGTGSVISVLRPQLWSLLFVGLLSGVLVRGSWRTRRWLPLLFLAWANLHGGWVVGLGMLGVFATTDSLVDRRTALAWIALGVACIGATLVTPYGLALWRFALDTVQFNRDITEWQPLWTVPMMNWLPCVIAAAAAVWATTQPRRHRWPVAAVLAMLAYSALRVSRIGPLFVEATAVFLAPVFVAAWPRREANRPAPLRLLAAGSAAISATIAAVVVFTQTLTCIEVTGPWVPPANAVRFLKSGAPGRLVTYFNWGEYAIWHVGPGLRVSMDGTRETVYSEQRIAEHDAILAGTPAGLQVLERWNAEYVWLPSNAGATKSWLAAHGYRIELDDAASFVAVRDDRQALTSPIVAPSSHRCFPD